ncbi:MAG: GerMN domain-containing protein [Treponema sp.]|nr:GerMN domain-containing protein [Treponema sp.]
MNGKTGNLQDAFDKLRPLPSWLKMRKKRLLLVFPAALALAALIDFFALGLARRTFLFYTVDSGIVTVEERMLRVSGGNLLRPASREVDIARYVQEALLGPVSPDSLPLFPRETRLKSLMYRNGVVYADFSEEAVLPPLEGGEVLTNMQTLQAGIARNFPYVRDQRFFIEGKAAYAAEFRRAGEPAGLERQR